MGTPVIQFYLPRDPYGFLSNFSRHAVFLKGRHWPTTEHYFQARKFAGTPRELLVLAAATPGAAADLGRSREHPLPPDWETIKEAVMSDALRAKFTQHADLRGALLDTGDAILVEHTANDAYWGDGGDGHGMNRLGVLLMRVRDALRQG